MDGGAIRVETVEVRTSYGVVPVTGNFRPDMKILAITGMRATPAELDRLPLAVGPRYGGLVAHLPGHSAPSLHETSVEAFAVAFDEVVEAVGASVVLGMSVGGLVALAMRSPRIRAAVVAEPPLETAKLWQLLGTMRRTAAEHAEFYDKVMGFDGEDLVGRSYLHLLDGISRPTQFIVGDLLPFPARASDRLLSTVDEAQRVLISRSPNATLRIARNAGHAVHRQAAALLLEAILEACEIAGGTQPAQ